MSSVVIGYVAALLAIVIAPGIGPHVRNDVLGQFLFSLAGLGGAFAVALWASSKRRRSATDPSAPAATETTEPLLYPAAPITLVQAVEAARAGNGKPLKAARWGLGDAGIVIVAWLPISLFIGGALVLLAKDVGGVSSTAGGLLTLVAVIAPWIALAGWPLLITRVKGNGPRIDLGLRWSWRDIGWGLLYGFAAFLAAIAMGALTRALFGEFSSAAGELGTELSKNTIIAVLFAITVSIGAPIVEEIAFRGLIFGALAKRRLAPWITVLLSAVIFGLFHIEPVRLLVLAGIALVLGFARWHTGSTTTTIVAHMMNNLPGALFLVFGS